MKKILLATLLMFGMFSCKMYDNKIYGTYTSQSPTHYDTTRYDKQNKPIPVYDSFYLVNPTYSQAYKWITPAQKRIFYAGSVMLPTFLVVAGVAGPSIPVVAGAFIGAYMAASPWEFYTANYTHGILIKEYDSLMKADGNLHVFWDKIHAEDAHNQYRK